MSTRIKQCMLVATLGVILSIVFVGTAQAEPSLKFSVTSSPCIAPCTVTVTKDTVSEPSCIAPCTVTVTDETANPDGYELTYEWDKEPHPGSYGKFTPDVRAGSPECLNANCSQARWTYPSPGEYPITERVSWSGGKSTERGISLHALDPADAPAPITLESPTTISLPATLVLSSTKPAMAVYCPGGDTPVLCYPYLIRRTGPDGSGLYHYYYRLPMASPGTITLKAFASIVDPTLKTQYSDEQTFTITVTGNAYQFGDVHTCYWPVLPDIGPPGKHVFDLFYYATMNTRVIVRRQIRRGNRWVTQWRVRLTFLSISQGNWPWARRALRIYLRKNPTATQRFIYEIKHGRKLLKHGRLSTKRICPNTDQENAVPIHL